ncbi:GPI ethanolamine phosphate transferase 1 [Rhagoletis pomonella]|uniref:GPI ethanolamine phosphate transferase 1 n=1 Tax=Rhagoletis pomonella TaxID=28610 RepID=UPI00177C0DB7|nr:GPI ethanolamine phosphate transferase 1 [Rhagoletis pomonella]
MWIINAIVVHLLLLGSIFVIYFRSPIITGLTPQHPISLEPPAKRLVLIVTDGLRAESFFRNGCNDIPHLSQLMLKTNGLVGVSHTRVPTESRPGHIALIAGLYEDPSAVTRGWKRNPVNFDSVFNRSSYTYAWGAADVLHIFSSMGGVESEKRLLIDAYDHELDFSGRDETYKLDEWVFKRVRQLLSRKDVELRRQEKVIFFLHLLGLDTAGHVHKPGTPNFLENLHRTDKGISEIYKEFERIFPDNRTAYVLTSDHGMTNSGSHGSSDTFETETPFFLWGAGIASNVSYDIEFTIDEDTTRPLYAIQQAQITPLMAALIGVAPPVNSIGMIPLQFLNASDEYKAHAIHTNALQLLAQFQALLIAHQRGLFSRNLLGYSKLNAEIITQYIESTEHKLQSGQFAEAIFTSYNVMQHTLEGIEYYQGYYRKPLQISTAATFIFWIIYCLQFLLAQQRRVKRFYWRWSLTIGQKLSLLLACVFLLLQRVPMVIAFYLLLPLLVWILLVQKQGVSLLPLIRAMPLFQLLALILCAELFVYSFFERKLIALSFLIYSLVINFRAFPGNNAKLYIWLPLSVCLAIFPLLPPSVGYANTWLLLLGMFATMIRPFVVKSHVHWHIKLPAMVCIINALLASFWHAQQRGVPLLSQALSWLFLIYTLSVIVLYRTSVLKQRIELIFYLLTSLYALLCTSYESLFIVMLASELMLTLSVQPMQLPIAHKLEEEFSKDKMRHVVSSPQQLQVALRLSFSILLYTLFSFFGTGNIASVSSFDPNIVRCFLSTFSPFIIMALVILKLVIPVLLNISIIFGMSRFARANEQTIFVCLMLICDVMGLNFLFLVRNEGSWLEIGTSISHFVIMEVTTVVLVIFTYFAKLLLHLNEKARNEE